MIGARAARQTGILCAATLAALLLASMPAFAACTSPAGNAGDVFYSAPSTIMVYCNGTSWIAMGVNSAVSFGTLTTNDFCTATSGTAIACTTGSTGTGSVVLSASPTLTGTVTGATSTWSGSVAIGTTTTSGALNVNGTATATAFSGSGASLTGIGTANLTAITGTPGSSTFLAGNGTWTALTTGTLPALPSADVWVGNGSNVPTATATTGTGNVVMSASPTLTGTVTAGSSTWSGYVGIGTPNPLQLLYLLQVQSGTSEPNGLNGSATGDTHTLMYFDGYNGSIGSKVGFQFGGLAGYSTGGIFSVLTSNSNNTTGDITFDLRNPSNAASLSEMMRIKSSGNVGIGSSSPRSLLDVAGTVYATLFSGSGASLTSIGTSNLTGITGTPSSTTYLTGNGTWSTVSVGTSGTVSSSPAGDVAYYQSTGTTVIGTNTLTISSGEVGVGTTSPQSTLDVAGNISAEGNAILSTIANAGTTGTTANKLAKLTGAPSTAVITATTDTGGAIGIVVGNAGTTGSAQIATLGQANCVFDSTATTAGDYVQISSATAGDCTDGGSTYPSTGQVIGRVLSTHGSGGGTYAVMLFGPGIQGTPDTPNNFASTNVTGQQVGATITSDTVTLSGFTDTMTAWCDSGCIDIIHNGGDCQATWCSGFVAGDTIAIKQVASISYDTPTTTTVTVGDTESTAWSVTTENSANAFSFTNQTNAAISSTITSNTVTLAGGTGSDNWTATCGSGCTGISINGGSFVSGPVTGVNSGNTIAIRQTSSSSLSTQTTATVTVGNTTSSSWGVTTGGITVVNIGSSGTSSSYTSSITLGTSVPAGSLIVVGAMIAANSGDIGTLTVTDSAGNTYHSISTQSIPGTIAGQTAQGAMFYTYNASALSSGGTITFSDSITSGVGFTGLTAFYATNILTTNPLDSSVTASANYSGGNPSITSGTPSQSEELFVAFVTAGEYYGFGTYTPDTSDGWTAPPSLFLTDSNFMELAGGTLINSGTATKSFSPTGINDPYAAWIVGFK